MAAKAGTAYVDILADFDGLDRQLAEKFSRGSVADAKIQVKGDFSQFDRELATHFRGLGDRTKLPPIKLPPVKVPPVKLPVDDKEALAKLAGLKGQLSGLAEEITKDKAFGVNVGKAAAEVEALTRQIDAVTERIKEDKEFGLSTGVADVKLGLLERRVDKVKRSIAEAELAGGVPGLPGGGAGGAAGSAGSGGGLGGAIPEVALPAAVGGLAAVGPVLGAGAIATSGAGALAAGLGPLLLFSGGLKDAIKLSGQLEQAQKNLTFAEQTYGGQNKQLAAAQDNYNAAVAAFGPGSKAAVAAHNQLLLAQQKQAKVAPQIVSAQNALNKLTAESEPGTVALAKSFGAFSDAMQTAEQQVLPAFGKALKPILDTATALLPTFVEMAKIDLSGISAGLKPLLATLRGGEFKTLLLELAHTFAQLAPILFRELADVLLIFVRTAVLAGPAMIALSREVAGLLDKVARFLSTPKGKQFIDQMVTSFRTWMGALVPLVGALLNLAVATVPLFTGAVKVLTPFIKLIAAALILVANEIRATVGPAFTWLVAHALEPVAKFLTGTLGKAFVLMLSPMGLMALALQHVGDIGKWLAGAWHTVWGAIKSAFDAVAPAIVGFLKVAFLPQIFLVNAAITAAKAVWGVAWRTIKAVFDSVAKPIAHFLGGVLHDAIHIVGVGVGHLGDVWKAVWGAMKTVLSGVLGFILGGISTMLGALGSVLDIAAKLPFGLGDPFKDAAKAVHTAQHSIDGFRTELRAASGDAADHKRNLDGVSGALHGLATAYGAADAASIRFNAAVPGASKAIAAVSRPFAAGAIIPGYATGGVAGVHPHMAPPPGSTDTVPAWLTPGEAVIPKPSVDKLGTPHVNATIAGKNPAAATASGGLIAAASILVQAASSLGDKQGITEVTQFQSKLGSLAISHSAFGFAEGGVVPAVAASSQTVAAQAAPAAAAAVAVGEDATKKNLQQIAGDMKALRVQATKEGTATGAGFATPLAKATKDAEAKFAQTGRAVGKSVVGMHTQVVSETTKLSRDTAGQVELLHKQATQSITQLAADVQVRFVAIEKTSHDEAGRAHTAAQTAFAAMSKDVAASTQAAASSVDTGFKKMVGSASKGGASLVSSMHGSMGSLDQAVFTGMSYVGDATNQALKALGVKPVAFSVAKPKAGGGWIGREGERGQDTVHALLGAGELVLNATGQRMVAQGNTDLESVARMQARFPHGSATPFSVGGYVNPYKDARSYSPGRTDEGFDAVVSGRIDAIGDAAVTYAGGPAGWPGTGAVVYRLTGGPDSGRYVYLAENITPLVRPGQGIHAGDAIANAIASFPFTEMGWASGPDWASGTQTLAKATTGYTEGQVTAAGSAFAGLLHQLGVGGATGNPNALPGVSVPTLKAPKISGPAGALLAGGQGALAKVTKAANDYLQKHAPTTSGGVGNIGPAPPGGYNQQTWAAALLKALGYGANSQSVADIVAWELQEGGNWNNQAHFNPLNTTENEPGHVTGSFGVGIKAYDSWASGLKATVDTLHGGAYGGILAALASGAPLGAFKSAVNSSPWGTVFARGGYVHAARGYTPPHPAKPAKPPKAHAPKFSKGHKTTTPAGIKKAFELGYSDGILTDPNDFSRFFDDLDAQFGLLGSIDTNDTSDATGAGGATPDPTQLKLTPDDIALMGGTFNQAYKGPVKGDDVPVFQAGQGLLDAEMQNRQAKLHGLVDEQGGLTKLSAGLVKAAAKRAKRKRHLQAYLKHRFAQLTAIKKDLSDLAAKSLKGKLNAALAKDRVAARRHSAQQSIRHIGDLEAANRDSIAAERSRGPFANVSYIQHLQQENRGLDAQRRSEQAYMSGITPKSSAASSAYAALLKKKLTDQEAPIKLDLKELGGSDTTVGSGGEIHRIDVDYGNITTAVGAIGDQLFHLQTGDIPGAKLDIESIQRRGATPAGATEDLTAVNQLLRTQLDQSRLTNLVLERQYDVLSKFPPYGGSFAEGGVVPGPPGAARTVIAHGGETIRPGGGPDVRVILEDHRTRVLVDDVERIIDQTTRAQGRRATRALPGRAVIG